MAKLPTKPSALITIALKDLRKVEANPDYKIDMGDWHRPQLNGRCSVCLAGAVMAQTLGASPSEELVPSSFDDYQPLRALNSLRVGDINEGLYRLGVDIYFYPGVPSRVPVPNYTKRNRDAFYAAMREMARQLAKRGL